MTRRKIFLIITGCLVLGLMAGYLIVGTLIRKKVDAALKGLPASLDVHYASLHANILTGSVEILELDARYQPSSTLAHRVTVAKIAIGGLSFLQWVTAHRLRVGSVRLEGVSAEVDQELLEKDTAWKGWQLPAVDAMVNRLEIEGLKVKGMHKGEQRFFVNGDLRLDSVTTGGVGAIRFIVADAAYSIPGMDETVRVRHLELDSKKRLVQLDTLEIAPDRDKEEIGRKKGHQVDVVRATVEGLAAEDLDVMGLVRHRLDAGEISLHKSRVYVFRDRRLPLEPGDKPMPVASLESLPVELRVGKVRMGTMRFEYEEYPKVGQKTGELTIEGMRGTIAPLLNRPGEGDPAFITLKTEGSLMGSGLVTATTLMPLGKDGHYEVEGAFHDLDVTRLNNPAENLGQLHLESGMLNRLDFQFEMGEERATGKIVGEYHRLVADKLKAKDGQLKTDNLKSFALKKLIIPKDKDKSLPVSKRTGKVDYKRDKQRYFSYYLLHTLLVGVKSSFSLGFLLPG